jgi:hypothetical protein
MKGTSVLVFALAVVMPLSLKAQSSSASLETEIDELKAQIKAQQKLLEKQQAQIQTLESALATQQKMLVEVTHSGANGSALVPAIDRTVEVKAEADGVPVPQNQVLPSDQQPLSSQAGAQQPAPPGGVAGPSPTPQKFNPTQEVASETPEGPALKAGPTQLRFGGYLGLTGLYRSTNSGNGTGTSFNSIPFSTTGAGNISESRLTANASRITLRADSEFPELVVGQVKRLSGYFEMDFNGYSSGTNDVTSSSAGFRLRHAFGEAQWKDHWLFAVGQAFSLMTPQKGEISMWPSDVEMSQAVDTNYLVGMLWARIPQARLTWRPSKTFSWAFSVENPEQQIGKSGVVTLPMCCATDIEAQYNTGGNELKVPDLGPDFVTRVAFNTKTFHVDMGGVIRVFRQNIRPYTNDQKQVGGGGNVNFSFRPVKGTKILAQGSYGAGMGRYIGGVIPDVSFKEDGSISPIRTTSWVTGIEQAVTKNISLAGYYNGVYASSAFFQDTDGTYIGYGFPGSPDSNNRLISEWSAVWAYRVFKTENRGSVQWNTQFSWLDRSPWAPVNGMGHASAFMFLSQIRYNLP